MFTIEQLKQAHAKVKSGADFPRYIQDVIALGVKRYETFVTDGHAEFYDSESNKQEWEAKYAPLDIAAVSNKGQFLNDLKAHQQGGSDYLTFCRQCAASGVDKWVVDTAAMTCTYYDHQGEVLLVEQIPR